MPAIDTLLNFLGHGVQGGTELVTGIGKGRREVQEDIHKRATDHRELLMKEMLVGLRKSEEENRRREAAADRESEDRREAARLELDRGKLSVSQRVAAYREENGGGSGRRRSRRDEDDGDGGGVSSGRTRAYNHYSKVAENYVRAAGGDVNAALAAIHQNPEHRGARVRGDLSTEMLRGAAAEILAAAAARNKNRGQGSRFGGGAAGRTPAPARPAAKQTITRADAAGLRSRGWSDAEIRARFEVR